MKHKNTKKNQIPTFLGFSLRLQPVIEKSRQEYKDQKRMCQETSNVEGRQIVIWSYMLHEVDKKGKKKDKKCCVNKGCKLDNPFILKSHIKDYQRDEGIQQKPKKDISEHIVGDIGLLSIPIYMLKKIHERIVEKLVFIQPYKRQQTH